EWADYCSPGLILAQAIGRWGNFFNQELYGPPTDLPWGIYIAPENRLPELRAFERFHPTFFYESALNFGAFLILYYLARNWRNKRLYGDIFFLYAIFYAIIRFFIEFLRPDAWKIGGVPTAQWVSLAMVVVFGGLLLIRHRYPKPSMIYQPGEPWQPPEEEKAAGEGEPEAVENPLQETAEDRDSTAEG
ncbi:MAG: prolipoprotein diacylglyceryl transferase, partial [Chloroflexi bacterium]|nr:prolipoprotein diacylglyceryl transferase [Chloroflexota bacterium]